MGSTGRVKCTYDDCTFWFEDEKEMIRHKKNATDHFYCHKCKVDCEDDTEYMIHQILSNNHIVCPSCGEEFKSSSGRDRHVEIQHAGSQRIPCRGCGMHFTRASALMRHIENDECRVIRLKDFQQERAERAIVKDGFEAMLDPDGGFAVAKDSGLSQASNETNNPGGSVSLLDNSGSGVGQDWQGKPINQAPPMTPTVKGSYRAPQSQLQGSSSTALSNFSALPPVRLQKPLGALPKEWTGDLLDVNDAGEKMTNISLNETSVWAQSQSQSHSHLFPQEDNVNLTEGKGEVKPDSKHDQLSEISFRTYSSQSNVGRMMEYANAADEQASKHLPPGHRAPDPNTYIITRATMRIPKIELHKYYDAILERYVCPGTKCRRNFRTPDQFHAHLLSPAHVGGYVVCPSCLRIYKTTSALISHMESGAKNCNVRNSTNYNQVLREVSAGLLGTGGHLEDGTIRYFTPNDEGWKDGRGQRAG